MYDTNCVGVGEDIRNQLVANVHECYNLCKADVRCGAFGYWGNITTCYLKTFCADNFSFKAPGFDFYSLGKVFLEQLCIKADVNLIIIYYFYICVQVNNNDIWGLSQETFINKTHKQFSC